MSFNLLTIYCSVTGEDWFADFGSLEPFLAPILGASAAARGQQPRILIVGCGNSTLPADLFDRGISDQITSVDISDIVIDQMRAKYGATHPQLRWVVGDVCALQEAFPVNGAFDLILDKGTCDTLLFRSHGKAEGEHLVSLMLGEMARLLAPPPLPTPNQSASGSADALESGGRFVWITLRRKPPVLHQSGESWDVETHRFEPTGGVESYDRDRRWIFCHVCRTRPSRVRQQRRERVQALRDQRAQLEQESQRAWTEAPEPMQQRLRELLPAATLPSFACLDAALPCDSDSFVPTVIRSLSDSVILAVPDFLAQYQPLVQSMCAEDRYLAPCSHRAVIIGAVVRCVAVSRYLVFADIVPVPRDANEALRLQTTSDVRAAAAEVAIDSSVSAHAAATIQKPSTRGSARHEWDGYVDEAHVAALPRLQLLLEESSAKCSPEAGSSSRVESSSAPIAQPPGIDAVTNWPCAALLRPNDIVLCAGVAGRARNGNMTFRVDAIALVAPNVAPRFHKI